MGRSRRVRRIVGGVARPTTDRLGADGERFVVPAGRTPSFVRESHDASTTASGSPFAGAIALIVVVYR